jgi:hypothetical protein
MDKLRGALRRAGAFGGETERVEAVLDVHGAEISGDLAVEPGHCVERCRPTTVNHRLTAKPGANSLIAGRSGRAGNRETDVTASGRSLPTSTIAPAAAIELISTRTPPAGGILSHLRRGAVGHLHEIEIRAAVEKPNCERGCAGRGVETDRQFAAMGPGVVENSGTAFTGSSAFTDNICGPRLHTMACRRGRTKELDWIPGLLSGPRLENAGTGSSVEADTGD